MDRDDDFDGDLSFDTSASRAKAMRLSAQRLSLHDDMVAEGVDSDIATIFLKICGHPPVVLRPLRKALLSQSGIDDVARFSIAAIRELPIRIPDPNDVAAAADEAAAQTVLYGYVAPTTDGGTKYATARESVFQALLHALWTSINADHERDGLPALASVADIDFAIYSTTYADFRLCVYHFLSFATVGTGEQLLACAKAISRGCARPAAKKRRASGSSLRKESLTK